MRTQRAWRTACVRMYMQVCVCSSCGARVYVHTCMHAYAYAACVACSHACIACHIVKVLELGETRDGVGRVRENRKQLSDLRRLLTTFFINTSAAAPTAITSLQAESHCNKKKLCYRRRSALPVLTNVSTTAWPQRAIQKDMSHRADPHG